MPGLAVGRALERIKPVRRDKDRLAARRKPSSDIFVVLPAEQVLSDEGRRQQRRVKIDEKTVGFGLVALELGCGLAPRHRQPPDRSPLKQLFPILRLEADQIHALAEAPPNPAIPMTFATRLAARNTASRITVLEIVAPAM